MKQLQKAVATALDYGVYAQMSDFDPGKVFFTSDTHFSHENIIRFCGRPFRNACHMDEEMIRRWKEKVPPDGVVFHLGDVGWGGSTRLEGILDELPGRIILILGNHDLKYIRGPLLDRFEFVTQQMSIRVDGQPIYLNHYPFLCYGGAFRDTWQLFGHVHSGPLSKTGLDLPRLSMLFPRQYDVGVDNNDFTPVSFAEVKARIEERVKAAAGGNDLDPAREGEPLVFVRMQGVLCPLGGGPSEEARELLLDLCLRTGARIVLLDSPVPPEVAPTLPFLRGLPLRGCTTPSLGSKDAISSYLSSSGGKHRYVLLSPFEEDDFRAVRTEFGEGLKPEDVAEACRILRYF